VQRRGRSRSRPYRAVALPVSLLLEPVWETLQFGQLNLRLMALIALDGLVERPRWPRGMLVGIAAAIELTPAAFVLFFLLRKDYGRAWPRPRRSSRRACWHSW
jgi:alpha-1,2-mannosyltransferase